MGSLMAAVFCVAAVLAGVVLAWSPGKAIPLVDENGNKIPGSISEKIRVRVNGVEQGMFIKSENPANPVLLFVHGGPGNPSYPLSGEYPTGLEANFTVCWWEQRGTGLSYGRDIPPETMTAGQMVRDTIGVTKYLCERFGQDRIYLMGHSWGTYVAILAAQRAPELYRAYIAMAQMTRQMESERLARDYMVEWYKKAGDPGMARKLERVSFDGAAGLPRDYRKIRDPAMHRAGVGTTRAMKSVLTGFIIPLVRCPEYSFGDKLRYLRGMAFSKSTGLTEIKWRCDVPAEVPSLKIPAYFFSGKYDYTCAYPLVREYYRALDAPVKGFYLFENSAHSPVFEESERANRILREDVMAGTVNLADE